MNALRRIHAALASDGLLIDPQPISAEPAVESDAGRLGSLDMHEWGRLIENVDERVAESLRAGIWREAGEQRYVVTDTFESGQELANTVRNWQGTRVPEELDARLRDVEGRAYVRQDVRMRVLRAAR